MLARAARHAAALVAAPGSESDDDLAALGLIADFGADGHAPFAGRGISPSELEALGSCPSRWFYRHVLRTRPPDDVAHDPFAWLDGARQGAVLHTVFERFGREVIAGTRSVHDVDAATVLDAMLDETLAHEARIRPPPSEWLRDEQRAALTAT
ncbi:MAG: PD-(D/E)XK nuclease family protein, partial [Gemmatimonadaceae bacterium]|nr:PD-(D/E)XK nuclease family protein [Gemmatimonadaceae bacterium]